MDIQETAPLKNDPNHPGKHIDTATGIWPMSEWGTECSRGFVSLERFARFGDRVIPRTDRTKTKKFYRHEYSGNR